MNLDERLSNVAIVGAAGKMGSGISLLLAQQLGMAKAKNPDKDIVLHLIDTRDQGLYDLVQYIRGQILKMAEKQIVKLRQIYKDRSDLVENSEIIDELVNTTLGILRPTKELSSAKDSSVVFEAVIESESLKIDIFKQLKSICKDDTYFFTNTSSIPIKVVDEGAGLQGRIIGYHFYNPPAIQKLLEIITSEKTQQDLQNIAEELAGRLRKTVVCSNDVAGFIGNGHFIREGLYALQKTKELQEQHSFTCAVYLMNKVTQDFLMRPMGIFQLLDYVGIDVYNFILQIMDKYIEGEEFKNELIDTMIKNNALGGQRGDGSQKDGFFQYEKGKMVGVYCYKQDNYVPLDSTEEWDKLLGDYPASWKPWKKMLKQKQDVVAQIFSELNSGESLGCQLASKYAQASKEIAENLVKNDVALCNGDVDKVLLTGFFHAYGITTI
ncbi:3-hydroxyacyl-CoA dehydrogenase family protein [Candidatus Uabimicrobium amorphum]|uniref:3-hydroxybutyryl-CoA dehydrogenase n=1 Tax=Uabimicrobium amorphum TaxID=2596890 RepID=A0A5S9IM34_UABAM|nr:3-hydroxyacyl-CoA dehydrogenase family protein [Candidatus Uabimicrobium amorphum]BBM83550.1 3-hydroxybutyryl-CoA dehydrogenase [Candidatus Uabimicrobium amorphum]